MDDHLNLIKESAVLDRSNLERLKAMRVELFHTMEKTQMFRTRTEMEVSVLNDIRCPTPASKYWQAMREQNVHFTELIMLSYEYRKLIIECKKIERAISTETDNFEKQLLEVELEKNQFIMFTQQKMAKERLREIANWSQIKEREAEQMGEEELADVDNHQLMSYTKRWIKQSIAMGGGGSPSERQNLLGQLRSGILACIRKGILDQMLKGFDEDVIIKVKKDYKMELIACQEERTSNAV